MEAEADGTGGGSYDENRQHRQDPLEGGARARRRISRLFHGVGSGAQPPDHRAIHSRVAPRSSTRAARRRACGVIVVSARARSCPEKSGQNPSGRHHLCSNAGEGGR